MISVVEALLVEPKRMQQLVTPETWPEQWPAEEYAHIRAAQEAQPVYTYVWRVLCGKRDCGGELGTLAADPERYDEHLHQFVPTCYQMFIPADFKPITPLHSEPTGRYFAETAHGARSRRHAPRRPIFTATDYDDLGLRRVSRVQRYRNGRTLEAAAAAYTPAGRTYDREQVIARAGDAPLLAVLAQDSFDGSGSVIAYGVKTDQRGRIVSYNRSIGDPYDPPTYIRCPHLCGHTSLIPRPPWPQQPAHPTPTTQTR